MTALEKALELVDNLQIPEFFEFVESITGVNAPLSQLKNEFAFGNIQHTFYGRLKLYAQTKLKNHNTTIISGNNNVVIQNSSNSEVTTPKVSFTKDWYVKSINEVQQLPVSVVKTPLQSNQEHYEKTVNLYEVYKLISLTYERYIRETLGADLVFPSLTTSNFVPTETNFVTQTKLVEKAIVELKSFLLHLNNPDNPEGLYAALADLVATKTETSELRLFKLIIQAINANSVEVYDLISEISIQNLLTTIVDTEVKNRVELFWKTLVAIKATVPNSLAKKKVFLDKILQTEEIKTNLQILTNYLFK